MLCLGLREDSGSIVNAMAQVKAEIGVELFLDTRINFFNVVLESLSNEYSLRKTLVYEYLMYRSSNN